MPPRKKRSTEAIAVAPTRRSTRTRRPSQAAAAAAAASEGFNQNNSQAQKTTTRDSKVPKKEASVTGGPQEDVVVHRPRGTAAAESTAAALPPPPPLTVATTTVKTTHISSGGDDETKSGGSEKAAITIAEEKGDSHHDKNIIGAVDYDMNDDDDSDDYDDDGNDDATDDDGDDDDESEDKIVAAHPSLPKAATRTLPVKIINKKSQSRRYVAVPAADEEDELATEQPAIKIVKVSDTSGGRKTRSKYDRPEEMLTNPRSPLVGARLRDLLCSAKAWDLLNPEERKQVLAKFPDQREILGGGSSGSEEARPNVAALKNNNNFRHDITRYQDNLAKGKHDPEWIRQAQDAHRKRELGMYEEYLAARFEEDWGIKMPGGFAVDEEEGRDDDDGDSGGEEEIEKEGTAALGTVAGADGEDKKEEEDRLAVNDDDQIKHVNAGDVHPVVEGLGGAREIVGTDHEMVDVPKDGENHLVAVAEQSENAPATAAATAAADDDAALNGQEMVVKEARGGVPGGDEAVSHPLEENVATAVEEGV